MASCDTSPECRTEGRRHVGPAARCALRDALVMALAGLAFLAVGFVCFAAAERLPADAPALAFDVLRRMELVVSIAASVVWVYAAVSLAHYLGLWGREATPGTNS